MNNCIQSIFEYLNYYSKWSIYNIYSIDHRNPEFINQAIELTTKNREDLNSKLIYPHDVFYRRVSKIDELFNSLFLVENEVIKVNSNEQAINYIIDTTNFFNVLL